MYVGSTINSNSQDFTPAMHNMHVIKPKQIYKYTKYKYTKYKPEFPVSIETECCVTPPNEPVIHQTAIVITKHAANCNFYHKFYCFAYYITGLFSLQIYILYIASEEGEQSL